jgi:hypothetical protein
MGKDLLKLHYKQQGMTLVEVLIAGIILFIAISAISLVARTKILNERRLASAIEQAYLAELSPDIINYHLKYTRQRQGEIIIAGKRYQWVAVILQSAEPQLILDNNANSDEMNSTSAVLFNLYNVVISDVEHEKNIFEFNTLQWSLP